MAAVKTQTILEHYEFKLTEAEVRLIGQALQKLPMEMAYATVMSLERQVQEQNFQLQQVEVQNKVSDASAEVLKLAPPPALTGDQLDANAAALNAAALNPDGEPPLVHGLVDAAPAPDAILDKAAAVARLATARKSRARANGRAAAAT